MLLDVLQFFICCITYQLPEMWGSAIILIFEILCFASINISRGQKDFCVVAFKAFDEVKKHAMKFNTWVQSPSFQQGCPSLELFNCQHREGPLHIGGIASVQDGGSSPFRIFSEAKRSDRLKCFIFPLIDEGKANSAYSYEIYFKIYAEC